jgi:two-component system, NtrC family, response regulator AtoC
MASAVLVIPSAKASDSLVLFPHREARPYMSMDYSEGEEMKAGMRDSDAAENSFVEGLGPSMRALEAVIRELARSEVSVLLLAERGAGKQATAERIHQISERRHAIFEMVSCADVSEKHLAVNGSGNGLFSAGTVYLEEIADLNSACQQKLLGVFSDLEGNVGHGGKRARLICGSSRDLELEVKACRFREDLYYRVSGVCLRLPPLRQRKEDIPYLVSFFLTKYAREFHRPVPQLSASTQRLFQEYGWPGNIRELADAAKAIVVLGDESLAMGGLRSLLMRSERKGNGEVVSLKEASRAASREAEKELILKALTRTRWNRRRAAQELRISYKALLYKLKQIGYQDYGAS